MDFHCQRSCSCDIRDDATFRPCDDPGSSVLKIHARLFRMSQIVYFIVKTTEMKYLGFRAAYCGILPYPHKRKKKACCSSQ